MGYSVLTSLHLTGLFAIYILNIACLITFLLLIDDLPFKHWRQKYDTESKVIFGISTLFAFKLCRFLFSQL